MKLIRTLIVLANEHDLRLLAHAGKGQPLRQIAHRSHTDWADSQAEFSDREGRMRKGAGPISALDRTTPMRAQNRAHFGHHVLAITESEWATEQYDRLVVAAPGKMLGFLRAEMPAPLKAAQSGDLDADLLHLALDNMSGQLGTMVGF